MLGGVRIPDAARLAGHSDGDAVAHAVADALLGPAGLPDLGTLFPADDDAWRGADSFELLGEVVRLVAGDGWWVDNIDIVIAAETPRLAPHMAEMATNLTVVLAPLKEPMGRGIHVSVRPKRAEGLGAIGRAEGIAVWAIVLLSLVGEISNAASEHIASLDRCSGSTTPQRAPGRLRPEARRNRLDVRVRPDALRRAHLGHGRKVVFDTIRRYLLWCGLDVIYVSNVTDVDDNIIERAQRTASARPSSRRSSRRSSGASSSA